MKSRAIADTGPLVAFLNAKDRYHGWAKARLAEIAPPMLTSEVVIAETCHLLRTLPGGARAALELVARGVVEIPFRLDRHAEAMGSLMARYADVPIALADASLVLLAEEVPGSTVLTLDSDFHVYRKHGRTRIPLIIPEDSLRR